MGGVFFYVQLLLTLDVHPPTINIRELEMYICKLDFDLFVEGKCFSFYKGQVFSGHEDCVKRLLVMGYIYRYSYSRPAIRFSRTGIEYFTPKMENKTWRRASM